ncbi:type II CAAX endopeptidase family protein [Lysobacter sp. CCNWLW3]|uniref:CPBP family intramembrane glutamic endopeptidase n=1 Tax=unclassified Lysobacter TaxID=2635362 RepID=UPI002FD4B39C
MFSTLSPALAPIAHLPWAALALASLLLWWPRLRVASLALLAVAGAAGFALGQLDVRALIALALLALAGWMVGAARKPALRIAGHIFFVLVALALGFHVAPGFHNPLAIAPTRLTADAIEFSMYLNLDKPLVGFWLVLVWAGVQRERPFADWFKAALPACLGVAALCLGLAFALGQVAWAPKWPGWGLLWAANNLLLVTLAEEALFRGYLQEGLTRYWRERRWGDAAAIAVAALAFGLVHLAGGWAWALLATVAGAGYGLAYRRGGLQAAMLTHFGFNLLHFTAFTYPMLA